MAFKFVKKKKWVKRGSKLVAKGTVRVKEKVRHRRKK